jgi:hypothetical protein
MGSGHVDIYRRTDPVMYVLEDRSASDRIIYGRTPKFATLTSEPLWQVYCEYYDNSVLKTVFANDAKYNCTWDDRVSYFSSLPPGDPIPGVSFTGTFSPSGLQNGGLVTIVTINNTTWTAVPAIPLSNRNAISIINRSGQEVKINYSNSVVGYVGVPIDDNSERFYDIKDSILLYAKSQTSSCTLIVEEIS